MVERSEIAADTKDHMEAPRAVEQDSPDVEVLMLLDDSKSWSLNVPLMKLTVSLLLCALIHHGLCLPS